MRGLTTFVLCLLIMVNIYGQEAVAQNQTKDMYLQKSKNQKTAAWVLLISGTAMAIGGGIAFDNSYDDSSNTSTDIYGIIAVAGVVADLASIPFFISAGKNKRKAASLSFNMQNYLPYPENLITSNPVPSISLRIKF